MSRPTNLDVDLEAAAAELRLALMRLMRRLRTEVNPGELTPSQTAAMARLDRAGWSTPADLARADSIKPQSMGAILNSLEQLGLAHRKPHPTDGRQVLFALTEAGLEARRLRRAAKQDWLLTALDKLTPEEQQALAEAIPVIRRLGEA